MVTKKRLTKSGKYVSVDYCVKAKPKTQPRKCLCCEKEFKSAGWHNRMCDKCRKL